MARIREKLMVEAFFDDEKQPEVVYFKRSRTKVWGSEDHVDDPRLIEEWNWNRHYESAMTSHIDYMIDPVDFCKDEAEVADDRRYDPDVYKKYEQHIIDAKPLPHHTKLRFDTLHLYIAEAPGNFMQGVLSMFNPKVWWNMTGKISKACAVFTVLQFLGIFIHQIFTVEFYALWLPFLFVAYWVFKATHAVGSFLLNLAQTGVF